MTAPIPIVSVADAASFDSRPAGLRLGLIALATDLTSEGDFARICAPRGIAVHATRVAYQNPTTAGNLRAMQPRLAEAASLIALATDLTSERSEEHTSELQSLMRNSYAVFCLKKKTSNKNKKQKTNRR